MLPCMQALIKALLFHHVTMSVISIQYLLSWSYRVQLASALAPLSLVIRLHLGSRSPAASVSFFCGLVLLVDGYLLVKW